MPQVNKEIVYNLNNKRSMKDKIKEILVDIYGIDGRHEDEATERILRLFNVVGQSEQYFCCKDQINQRCGEQCLGCFQFENKD